MTLSIEDVGGIVLCGGRSRRMGQPKALLPFGEEPLLARVVRLVSQVVDPVVVVAAKGQSLPTLPASIRIVCDDVPNQGPLRGLTSGLSALTDCAKAAFVTACDMPFLQAGFVERLVDRIGDTLTCAVQTGTHCSNKPFHPLPALYRLDVLGAVRKLLRQDERKLGLLLEVVPTRFVVSEEWKDIDPELRSLCNVNTPEDYRQALRQLAEKRW